MPLLIAIIKWLIHTVETEENALFRNVATMDLLFFVKYGNALGISVGRSLGTATDIQFCKKN
jgi:hypothetical protein